MSETLRAESLRADKNGNAILARSRTELAALVKAFSDNAKFSELETLFIEYLEKNPIFLHDHCDGDFENKTESEIVANVLDQHQQVIALYSYLKEQAIIPHHIDLLSKLLKLENQEIILMAQGLNRFQDM